MTAALYTIHVYTYIYFAITFILCVILCASSKISRKPSESEKKCLGQKLEDSVGNICWCYFFFNGSVFAISPLGGLKDVIKFIHRYLVNLTYLDKILETQPWLTRNCRDISHGRTPLWASSTIRCRTTSGRGRPLTKTPPS